MAAKSSRLFDPASSEPFRLSRSKIDLFFRCPRCFYLDRRLGIGQPGGPPFSLNIAVDELLKREFDAFRAQQRPHPLMEANGIDALPFRHPDLDVWRDSLRRGITASLSGTTFVITGGIDDVWVSRRGALHVVDYKATAKQGEVSIDEEWQIAYKRQVEIYQWLFRQNGFDVDDVAYFVYCNGDKSVDAFHGRLNFSIKVIPYRGSTAWVDGALREAHATLASGVIPDAAAGCDFCRYRKRAAAEEAWTAGSH